MPRIIKPAKGTFTTADITVDSSGRIIAASTGSADSTPIHPTDTAASGPASGTYTAASNVNVAQIYLRGGGGGGAGSSTNQPGANAKGGDGGNGGFGLWAVPVTQPYSAPYSVGAPGNAGSQNSPGGAGGATNFVAPGPTTYAANGGNGGTRGPTPAPTKDGSVGTISPAPEALADFTSSTVGRATYPVIGFGDGGTGKQISPQGPGNAGDAGSLIVYDNE